MKIIFLYLRGTSSVVLVYENDTHCLVTSYSDSDCAGDGDSRGFMNDYAFTFGVQL